MSKTWCLPPGIRQTNPRSNMQPRLMRHATPPHATCNPASSDRLTHDPTCNPASCGSRHNSTCTPTPNPAYEPTAGPTCDPTPDLTACGLTPACRVPR
eukprot:365486-Chlamydomonas_euryale.AAC.15